MASQIRRSGPLVWLAPNHSVDSSMMKPTPIATGSQALNQKLRPPLLFDMIVGRLSCDDHVMHVALAQAGAADAHKLRLLLQLGDAAAAQIAHAGAQPSD